MTDIVYALKDTTLHNCDELRYSLRSLEKHLSGVGKVVIVSESVPEWMIDVVHIKGKDYTGGHNKEFNIASKISGACLDERVSETFLFVNDDHFLLSDYNADTFPYYYYEALTDKFNRRPRTDSYKIALKNTLGYLEASNKPLKYFDVHSPILYNKDRFYSIIKNAKWNPHGFVIKSLYCNMMKIEGEEMQDLKLQPPLDLNQLQDRKWFSTCNRILSPEFWDWMACRFPGKSRWEK